MLFTPETLGKIGEGATAFDLKIGRLLGIQGITLRNLYVPKKDGGTTEIDLVFLTRKGIFVIESKNYSGWIFGDEEDAQWTSRLPGGESHRVYNPVRQNQGHIRHLRNYLRQELPMISLVVFSERCTLKKVPENRLYSFVIKRDEILWAVRQAWKMLPDALSQEQVIALEAELRKLTKTGAERQQTHIAQVREIQEAAAQHCPRCGGKLVLRTAKKGINAGAQFYGCDNYPHCRFTKPL